MTIGEAMQVSVLSGTYADSAADFRSSYPVNLIPVPKDNGISKGYLRPADGLIKITEGPGIDRGGINWNGAHYRVMGTRLVRIDSLGAITDVGDVGEGGQVSFDYSFDRLAVSSGGRFYYLLNGALSRVTDEDLGTVLDFVWIDGYFVTTDGQSLVVTELSNPASVNPLKYGSSEADPDPIVGVAKLQNEIFALNRYTIEVFDNVGGETFPFQRIEGAMIPKGVIGTHAACELSDALAFVGSGRGEAPAVYLGQNARANKLSTREIDQVLARYTEAQLSKVVLEKRVDKGHEHLWVHLPDRVLIYDLAGSIAVEQPLWFVLTSGIEGFGTYRARNLVWVYDKWWCADPTTKNLGYLDSKTSHHWGDLARWEFGTTIVYNQGNGGIFHQLELVCLTGHIEIGKKPTISTSYSLDGETWSQEKFVSAGRIGERSKRIVWFQQGHVRNWRIQRFKGNSQAHISIARLEALLEPLAH